jgi:glycosyltransferase involved in cell wall biosynthesis
MPGQHPPAFAIILTHNRPELLHRCVQAVAAQVDTVIVVDNASDPPVVHDELRPAALPAALGTITVPDQPPNLSNLWNRAFDQAAHLATNWVGADRWDLVVLCDDAIVPPGWVRLVVDGMRQHGGAAACTLPIGDPMVKTEPDRDIMHRMVGWAFALRGEARLRADERLHFWWCDTHLDWLARAAGGMVVVPGPAVPNERPNDFLVNKPGMGEQAGRDGETFSQIHGWRPW